MTRKPIQSAIGSRRFERFCAGRHPRVGLGAVNSARLVDMSVMGAGLESPVALKTGRIYAIKLPDSAGTILDGRIQWTVEVPGSNRSSSRLYRVGLDLRETAPGKAGAILDFIATALISGAYEPRRILVVDDNLVERASVAAVLLGLGHEVLSVESGAKALRALNERDFDLVFMDCEMPDLDGFETTRRIRRGHSRYRNVPVVALTSLSSRPDRQRCLAAGMNGHIAKPAASGILEATVARWSSAEPSPEKTATNELRV